MFSYPERPSETMNSPSKNTWQNGRWLNARQTHSPNFSPREPDENVSLVVLHNISLPPFEYNTGAVEKLFTNQINPNEHPFSASSTPCASPAIFSSAVRAKPSNSFPATTWPIMPAYRRFKAEKNAMPFPSVSNWKAAISSLLPKHNTPAYKPC